MKRVKPCQREGVADGLGGLDVLADESQLGAQPYLEDIFCCRTRRRSSALRPQISFSTHRMRRCALLAEPKVKRLLSSDQFLMAKR
ncbi:hypothetical protein ACVWW4_003984 [Bradyrhizobium sp. LB7.1]